MTVERKGPGRTLPGFSYIEIGKLCPLLLEGRAYVEHKECASQKVKKTIDLLVSKLIFSSLCTSLN